MTKQITGTVIADRYKITGYLRDGRMGNVYIARRIEDNAKFAVKMLDPGLFGEEEAHRRFEREIRVQTKIKHPNSMAVFEAGKTEDGLPWIVAEYFVGDQLNDFIEEKGTIPAPLAVDIAAQIALALEAAHDIGIVHRDLSPENIMVVDPEGNSPTVKVLDFGLAGVADKSADEDTSLTAIGVRVGTPYYMAPEYIEDFECDHRADLYALGIVLYEMLTGSPPFDGRPYKVMDRHVNEVPKPLSDHIEVEPWLETLVARLLEKQPDDRPATARAVVAAIENGTGHSIQSRADVHPQAAAEETAEPTEHTMIGHDNVDDPVLDRFRASLVITLDRRTGKKPPARDCLVVERISKYSVPARLGVKPGSLVQVENQDEGLLDPTLLTPAEQRTYRFHIDGEQVRMTTSGALLGMSLARSVENIRTYYNPNSDPPTALLELWKQGAWKVLERLALRALTGSSSSNLASGLFAKFMGASKPKPMNHPAMLFYGAALVETGRGSEGFPYIQDFKAQFSSGWPEIYLAVATAYMGLQRLQSGKRELGIELLEQSYMMEQLQKVRRALVKTVGHAPEVRQLYRKPFPKYNLVRPDGYPGANLDETLSLMDTSQVLLVCLLGGFRGNSRYNDFMMRFLNYSAHFGEFVAGVHVCTTVKDRTNDHRPEWFTGEDLVVAAGSNMVILEDYRAFVQREAKPTRIPTIYAINRDGLVLHEGGCDSPDLWNAIGRAGQLRMHKLQH